MGFFPAMASTHGSLLFLGTYTPAGGASRGVYTVRLDPATGALGEPVLAAETPNPTFLAWHPDGRTLYALGESGTVNGKPGGALTAFRFDAASATLAKLNTEPTGGIGLAHVGVDATGRTAAVISYHGGQVAAFRSAPTVRSTPARRSSPTPGRWGQTPSGRTNPTRIRSPFRPTTASSTSATSASTASFTTASTRPPRRSRPPAKPRRNPAPAHATASSRPTANSCT